MTDRRRFLSAALALGSGAASPALLARDYPGRAITILVGFPPGGGVDGPLRQVSARLSQLLGVPVVVENLPGANQMLAIRRIRAAAADGHTLFAGTASSLSQNPVLDASLGYDPLVDFSPIGRFAVSPALLVVPAAAPWKDFAALVAYARAHPGQLRYASAGIGSTSHYAIEILARHVGIELLHVPYRGDAAAAIDTAEGRVDLGLNVSTTLVPFLSGGKLRMLASTSAKPLPFAPGVPSLATLAGPALVLLDPYTFYGLVGPRGLPAAIQDTLARALAEATRSAELAHTFREVMYAEPVSETPAQFHAFLQRQAAGWKPHVGTFDK